MSLRERQRHRRREQILDAARRLVRTTGGTDFPMRRLAEEAEVSLVTPYNLFGSKGGVFYALLDAWLERLASAPAEETSGTAGDSVLDLAAAAARDYARDATFYRPLMRFLLGVPDAEHRPRLVERSLRYWRHTIEVAIADGVLEADVDTVLLARQLMITFIGTVELWVHEDLDDEAFITQSLYGSVLLVRAWAGPAARSRLDARLRDLGARLPRQLGPAAGASVSAATVTTA